MRQISYTEARATLASVLDAATDDLEEVVVTRAGHDAAVVVSLREYEALKETAHLLGTPANARHLQRGLEEFAAGGFAPQARLDVPDGDATGDSAGVA
ncbi:MULTISPECIES: type II toxin-antitoxin system Phd/YefM family antitoxin [Nocardia]|uniref:Antitoxin n=3 Tax=Nocardia TaxID=1817 RepID=A0A4R6P3R6_NOCIG|nr:MULTISPECIES: type II toxin-antitoxin system prevent-host-death family antitoxin [Nocardia]KAF0849623.1 antitoxin YefM [Nocardia caishijiensis]NKX91512.1 type II toxin-antitoxin system prevent-host-death family antitoxin [Nocardia coubleae]TDP32434.1 antitoxin YefM [Nocardia ignorata]